MQPRFLPLSTAALLLGSASATPTDLPASQNPTRELASADDLHSVLHFDEPGDERLWVRGRTYKASFGPDGATYVPFLGSHAPRNFPVRFRLLGASADGRALDVEASPTVRREGDVAVLDRGAVREHYLLGLDSVEQRFTFPDVPRGGDVVLRLAVDSDLARRDDAGGFAFDGPYGGVRMGTATALDADGATRSMPMEWDAANGTLSMRVPADFVATARMPLTVDPILKTWVIDDTAAELMRPDLAYAGSTSEYLAVYMEYFSGNDTDVYSRAYDENGDLAGEGYVDQTSDTWENPAVAYNLEDERYLVVASVYKGAGSQREIWGRGRHDIFSAYFTPFQVSSSGSSGHKRWPDVGGSLRAGDDSFGVVWEREVVTGVDHDIQSAVVTYDGGFYGSGNLANGSAYDIRPRIADSTGPATYSEGSWPVVWQRGTVQNASDVMGAILRKNGSNGTGVFPIDQNPAYAVSEPDVTRFLDGAAQPTFGVSYTHHFTTGDSDIDVDLFRATSKLDHVSLSVLEGHSDLEQMDSRIATDGKRMAVTYLLDHPSRNWEPYAATLVPLADRLVLTEGAREIGFSNQIDVNTTITARASGGGDDRHFMIAWNRDLQGPVSVMGSFYQAPESLGGSAENYCGPAVPNSSGFSAKIATDTKPVAGQPLNLIASKLPTNQFCYALTSQTPGFVHAPGSDGNLCLGGQIARFTQQIANSGAAGSVELLVPTTAIPLNPPVTAQPGDTWYFQVWFRDGMSSNFTDGLEVVFE